MLGYHNQMRPRTGLPLSKAGAGTGLSRTVSIVLADVCR
jgi:hypothetical protein